MESLDLMIQQIKQMLMMMTGMFTFGLLGGNVFKLILSTHEKNKIRLTRDVSYFEVKIKDTLDKKFNIDTSTFIGLTKDDIKKKLIKFRKSKNISKKEKIAPYEKSFIENYIDLLFQENQYVYLKLYLQKHSKDYYKRLKSIKSKVEKISNDSLHGNKIAQEIFNNFKSMVVNSKPSDNSLILKDIKKSILKTEELIDNLYNSYSESKDAFLEKERIEKERKQEKIEKIKRIKEEKEYKVKSKSFEKYDDLVKRINKDVENGVSIFNKKRTS